MHQAFWQDHFCIHVCSRHDFFLSKYGAFNLQYLQTHFPETTKKYSQVFGAHFFGIERNAIQVFAH